MWCRSVNIPRGIRDTYRSTRELCTRRYRCGILRRQSSHTTTGVTPVTVHLLPCGGAPPVVDGGACRRMGGTRGGTDSRGTTKRFSGSNVSRRVRVRGRQEKTWSTSEVDVLGTTRSLPPTGIRDPRSEGHDPSLGNLEGCRKRLSGLCDDVGGGPYVSLPFVVNVVDET